MEEAESLMKACDGSLWVSAYLQLEGPETGAFTEAPCRRGSRHDVTIADRGDNGGKNLRQSGGDAAGDGPDRCLSSTDPALQPFPA